MSEKIFRDTRIQIGILKSRGVIIKNKKWAKQTIRTINYYNLVNGYKEPFLQTGTTYEKYISGTTLEEIHALYEFDRKLRIITIEYILEVEKQAKSLIAYSFSKLTDIRIISNLKILIPKESKNTVKYVIY